jgi:PAB-dependent poly(A)-specific ribonuclease subunit 2
MPYYRENLLSQWPTLVFEAGRMQPKIDQDLQPLMKRGEIGLYGPNLKHLRPNNVAYTRIELEANKNLVTPKFLSEKAREPTPEEDRGFGDAISAMQNVNLDNSMKRDVPHTIYQNVEIKYSRFGVDDFDFE